jgi:acetolactate synthase-1/2/3 large subunit
MKVSDYIISFLASKESNVIFSLSGGMITHLEDSVFLNSESQLISVKHEQAGAFAAEWYARVSGRSGVAMATSGPGATNLVTGIASAYFDSIPVLYITGQVRTDELTPADSDVRQTWFQETKIVPIVKPITKYASHVEDILMLRYELEKAYTIMHAGRKWPVLLDIPMNIQQRDIDPESLPSYYGSDEYIATIQDEIVLSEEDISSFIHEIQSAKRPIVLVGGWIRTSGAQEILASFLEKSHIPVVASLMGIDAVDHDYMWYIGMIGSYGVRHANILLSHADLVIVLGSRLDLRQTGAMKAEFVKHGKIIHVDVDKSELGYNVKHTQMTIHANVRDFLNRINSQDISYPELLEWHTVIHTIKGILPLYPSKSLHGFIHPNYFFSRFTEICPTETIYVNDVWQNQMWASQTLNLKKWDRLLNSGWLGAMWFSIPVALGAAYAPWVKRVISFNGDGWFQMNIQELETISSRNLQLGIVILNNKSLGMVREFQDTYFEWRNVGTVIGYSCPDLSLVANTYRMPYFKIERPEDIDQIFPQISKMKWPYILEVLISNQAIVEPKMMYGDTLSNQSPPLSIETEKIIQNLFT